MESKAINFTEKFALVNKRWFPKIVAKMDNYFVKIVKIKGHFTWHAHATCDEIFIVHKGTMRIDFRDDHVVLSAGEMFVVEKGREHKPFSEETCEIILLEREDVVNTGDVKNEFTRENLDWI